MAKGIIYQKKRENEKILMIKCINFAKVQEIKFLKWPYVKHVQRSQSKDKKIVKRA